ncbi:MAG: hypothetical protein J5737_01910 [Bacteroidales bacterium]|nr:hypothetical protein [Bacteroidales bacterium]
MTPEKKSKPWVKDLLVAFAATTLSIILTFGTTMVVNRINQMKERKLTALMVMSSIESFARGFEDEEKDFAHIDSIATWLLGLSIEDVVKLGDDYLADPLDEVMMIGTISHDQTAESIFSSNIDTWKNMGIFQFIDNVGTCFSLMNRQEDHLNSNLREYHAAKNVITDNPGNYPGNSMAEKYLRNELFRSQLALPRVYRRWLLYCAASLRELNRYNMSLIGITEKEVMEFTDSRGSSDGYELHEVSLLDFEKPVIDKDSLAIRLSFAREADRILHVY